MARAYSSSTFLYISHILLIPEVMLERCSSFCFILPLVVESLIGVYIVLAEHLPVLSHARFRADEAFHLSITLELSSLTLFNDGGVMTTQPASKVMVLIHDVFLFCN